MDGRRGEVDTARPFGSVKEAVTAFDERFLRVGDGHVRGADSALGGEASPKRLPSPPSVSSPPFSSPSPTKIEEDKQAALGTALRRLESDMEETKREVALLKEREKGMEAAVATLTAELHESMGRAAAAAAAKAPRKSLGAGAGEGDLASDLSSSLEYSSTLAQLLSLGGVDGGFGEGRTATTTARMQKKEKPIMPLITDVLSRKKADTADLRSIYSGRCSGVFG